MVWMGQKMVPLKTTEQNNIDNQNSQNDSNDDSGDDVDGDGEKEKTKIFWATNENR